MCWFIFQVLKEVSSSGSEDENLDPSPDSSPLPEDNPKKSTKRVKVQTLAFGIFFMAYDTLI